MEKKTLKNYSERCKGPLDSRWVQTIQANPMSMRPATSFVGWDYIARLLNETFGAMGWSLEFASRTPSECIMDVEKETTKHYTRYHAYAGISVRLSIHPEGEEIAVKNDFGWGDTISRHKGQAMGDAIKGAYSDAVKRCARWLGDKFGLALYLSREINKYDLGVVVKGEGDRMDSLRPVELPRDDNFPWLDREVVAELKNLSLEIRKTKKSFANYRIESGLKDAISRSVVTYHVSGGYFKNEEAALRRVRKEWKGISGGKMPTLLDVKEFLKKVEGYDNSAETKASEDPMPEDVASLDNGKRYDLGPDGKVLDSSPPPRIGAKEVTEEDFDNFSEVIFGAEEVGYKIMDSFWDASRIILNLAVTQKNAIVEAELIPGDEAGFDGFLVSLRSSKDNLPALERDQVLKEPASLIGWWGYADFAVAGKGKSRRTCVSQWCQIKELKVMA